MKVWSAEEVVSQVAVLAVACNTENKPSAVRSKLSFIAKKSFVGFCEGFIAWNKSPLNTPHFCSLSLPGGTWS